MKRWRIDGIHRFLLPIAYIAAIGISIQQEKIDSTVIYLSASEKSCGTPDDWPYSPADQGLTLEEFQRCREAISNANSATLWFGDVISIGYIVWVLMFRGRAPSLVGAISEPIPAKAIVPVLLAGFAFTALAWAWYLFGR